MNEHEEWVAAMKYHILDALAGVMMSDRERAIKALEDLVDKIDEY